MSNLWTALKTRLAFENTKEMQKTRAAGPFVFSNARSFTFPSCSQMPVVFYHSVIHVLGFFIC